MGPLLGLIDKDDNIQVKVKLIEETLKTSRMCYWSRSRQTYWRKGESSGHWQTLKAMSTDCDGDVLLAMVDQEGAACHTERRSCFYLKFEDKQVKIIS